MSDNEKALKVHLLEGQEEEGQPVASDRDDSERNSPKEAGGIEIAERNSPRVSATIGEAVVAVSSGDAAAFDPANGTREQLDTAATEQPKRTGQSENDEEDEDEDEEGEEYEDEEGDEEEETECSWEYDHDEQDYYSGSPTWRKGLLGRSTSLKAGGTKARARAKNNEEGKVDGSIQFREDVGERKKKRMMGDSSMSAMAAQIGVDFEGLLRAIQNSSVDDQHKLMEQAAKRSNIPKAELDKLAKRVDIHVEDTDPDAPAGTAVPHSSEMRVSSKRPSMLIRGGQPKPKSILRTRSPNGGSKAAREVQFTKNEVSTVVAFEVDNELFMAIKFKRHWLGWVTLFLGLMFDCMLDAHGIYVLQKNITKGNEMAIQNWVMMMRFLVAVVIVGGFWGAKCKEDRPMRWAKTTEGLILNATVGFAFSLAEILQVVVVKETKEYHFFIAANFHSMMIIGYRLMAGEHVFFAEVAGSVVAAGGFIMSALQQEASTGAITGNFILLIASVLLTIFFLLMFLVRQRTPMSVMTSWVGLTGFIGGFLLATFFGVPLNTSSSGMFGCFRGEFIFHAILLGIEGLASFFFYLEAVQYLDILSVSSCYILKTVIIPYINYWLIFPLAGFTPQSAVDEFHSVIFHLGCAVVVVGCMVVIVFASWKREFVARRMASAKRRPIPNPYRHRRKKKGPRVPALQPTKTAEQAQLELQMQMQHCQQPEVGALTPPPEGERSAPRSRVQFLSPP